MRHFTLCLLAAGVFGLLGAESVSAAPGALGNDMAGEACQLAGSDIVCGAGQIKIGSLRRVVMNGALPGGDAARRGAIASAIRALPGNDTAAGLSCDGGKASTPPPFFTVAVPAMAMRRMWFSRR